MTASVGVPATNPGASFASSSQIPIQANLNNPQPHRIPPHMMQSTSMPPVSTPSSIGMSMGANALGASIPPQDLPPPFPGAMPPNLMSPGVAIPPWQQALQAPPSSSPAPTFAAAISSAPPPQWDAAHRTSSAGPAWTSAPPAAPASLAVQAVSGPLPALSPNPMSGSAANAMPSWQAPAVASAYVESADRVNPSTSSPAPGSIQVAASPLPSTQAQPASPAVPAKPILKRPQLKKKTDEAPSGPRSFNAAAEVTPVANKEAEPEKLKAPADAQLFIFGIPEKWKDTDIVEFCKDYGTIVEAKIGKEKDTGRNRGFGFVSFTTHEEAKAAQEDTNGVWLKDKRLRVTFRDATARAGQSKVKRAKT